MNDNKNKQTNKQAPQHHHQRPNKQTIEQRLNDVLYLKFLSNASVVLREFKYTHIFEYDENLLEYNNSFNCPTIYLWFPFDYPKEDVDYNIRISKTDDRKEYIETQTKVL